MMRSTIFILGRKQIRKCVPAVKVPTTFQTILNTIQGNDIKIDNGLNGNYVSRFDRERAGDVLKEEMGMDYMMSYRTKDRKEYEEYDETQDHNKNSQNRLVGGRKEK